MARDRCDRCGVAAKVKVILPSGAELLWCGHHYNEHESKLLDCGGTVERLADRVSDRLVSVRRPRERSPGERAATACVSVGTVCGVKAEAEGRVARGARQLSSPPWSSYSKSST